jgi:branched-chain amino acid transport system permease protein
MSAQDVVNGLVQGGMFAIVALGLSLVFGVLRLVNFAHGALLMAGGYGAYELQRLTGIDPLLALVIVVPVAVVLAYPVQRYLLTRLMGRSTEVALVGTFAIALVIQGVLEQAFSTDGTSLNASYSTAGLDVLGIRIEVIDLITLALAIVLVAAVHLTLTRTRAGTAARAAAADPVTAATMGIDVQRVYAVTFAVGAALAAIGGVMIGLGTSITPDGGLSWLVIGFAVVVLGGVGDVRGTLLAALALGVIQAVGSDIFGSAYSDLIVYATFFLVLSLRPSRLSGLRLT